MPFSSEPLFLAAEDRAELESWAHSRTLRAGDVMRARLILCLADGVPYRVIMRRLGITAPTISLWKRRFQESGMEGLEPQHRGTSPRKITPAVQARIVARTPRAPPDGGTPWSCRKMARWTGVSAATVHRV